MVITSKKIMLTLYQRLDAYQLSIVNALTLHLVGAMYWGACQEVSVARQRKQWPSSSRWARDEAAKKLSTIIRTAQTLLDTNDPNAIKAGAEILHQAHEARDSLREVGAPYEE